MSNHNEHLQHPDVGYEREDLSAKAILYSLVGLAVFALVIHFSLITVFKLGEHYGQAHQKEVSPIVSQAPVKRVITGEDVTSFPQPRLEEDERTEIFSFRLREEKQLNSYGVDPKTGVAHIPIEQAMDLIAQRGLNTTPKTGTVPPAIVNMVKEAAERSDHSSGSTGLEKTGIEGKKP